MDAGQAVILTLLFIFAGTMILYHIVSMIIENFARKITRIVMKELVLIKGENK